MMKLAAYSGLIAQFSLTGVKAGGHWALLNIHQMNCVKLLHWLGHDDSTTEQRPWCFIIITSIINIRTQTNHHINPTIL